MNTGKTLFAQLMDFLPWTTFTRIVDRYGGDHRVRTLSCAEQYRSMGHCQTNWMGPVEPTIEGSQTASWRHSAKAAERLSLKLPRL